MKWTIQTYHGVPIDVDQNGVFSCEIAGHVITHESLAAVQDEIFDVRRHLDEHGAIDSVIDVDVLGLATDGQTQVCGRLQKIDMGTGRLVINGVQVAFQLMGNQIVLADHPDIESLNALIHAAQHTRETFNRAMQRLRCALAVIGVDVSGYNARSSTFTAHREKEKRLAGILHDSRQRRLHG